jgi:hypothetical protein
MPIGKNFTSVLEIRTVESDLKVLLRPIDEYYVYSL